MVPCLWKPARKLPFRPLRSLRVTGPWLTRPLSYSPIWASKPTRYSIGLSKAASPKENDSNLWQRKEFSKEDKITNQSKATGRSEWNKRQKQQSKSNKLKTHLEMPQRSPTAKAKGAGDGGYTQKATDLTGEPTSPCAAKRNVATAAKEAALNFLTLQRTRFRIKEMAAFTQPFRHRIRPIFLF